MDEQGKLAKVYTMDAVHFNFFFGILTSVDAMEAFTRAAAVFPVNTTYYGAYDWSHTIGLCTNVDLYTGSINQVL